VISDWLVLTSWRQVLQCRSDVLAGAFRSVGRGVRPGASSCCAICQPKSIFDLLFAIATKWREVAHHVQIFGSSDLLSAFNPELESFVQPFCSWVININEDQRDRDRAFARARKMPQSGLCQILVPDTLNQR
jgi:hypothetical protein